MSRSRATFIFCIVLSAGVHAALIEGLRQYVNRTGSTSARVLPERVVQMIAPPVLPDAEIPLGEANGAGDAINKNEDVDLQTALKATQDQAAQTREPEGHQPMTAAAAPQPMRESVFAPPPAALPAPPVSHAVAPHSPSLPTPPAQTRAPPRPQAPAAAQQQASASSAGGRPLEHSDRDSDLFAKSASVEYKRGKVSAQSGREIKFARPQENLAAAVDSAVIDFPAKLKMLLQLDETGHVRDVKILHGTGSSSIDRIFELATYASWFEPAQDRSGRPIRDEFEFAIVLD